MMVSIILNISTVFHDWTGNCRAKKSKYLDRNCGSLSANKTVGCEVVLWVDFFVRKSSC